MKPNGAKLIGFDGVLNLPVTRWLDGFHVDQLFWQSAEAAYKRSTMVTSLTVDVCS